MSDPTGSSWTGLDQTVSVDANCEAHVSLNGNGSSDADGDTLTFTWTGDFDTASGATPSVTLPLGTHTLTLTVDDGKGGTASDIVVITVIDSVSPEILTLTVSPGSLWPPNHRMVPVAVSGTVADHCTAAASIVCQIISVSSNEPIDGLGDGDTAPDWDLIGDLGVSLRAERSGNGGGRIYTITVECTDDAGNSTTKTVIVTVPHDGRRRDLLARWVMLGAAAAGVLRERLSARRGSVHLGGGDQLGGAGAARDAAGPLLARDVRSVRL